MQINNIFSSFIVVDELNNIDNESIINFVLDLKSKSVGKNQSNKEGWQSENLDISLPIFNTLFSEINIRAKEIHNTIGLKQKLENKLDTAWVNVNINGGYNVQHRHMSACFSGTYYLRGVESGAEGNIVFKNPIEIDYHMHPDISVEKYTNITSGVYNVPPEKGKLIIFPSWLEHYVEPNLTNEDRITLSFDTNSTAFFHNFLIGNEFAG